MSAAFKARPINSGSVNYVKSHAHLLRAHVHLWQWIPDRHLQNCNLTMLQRACDPELPLTWLSYPMWQRRMRRINQYWQFKIGWRCMKPISGNAQQLSSVCVGSWKERGKNCAGWRNCEEEVPDSIAGCDQARILHIGRGVQHSTLITNKECSSNMFFF